MTFGERFRLVRKYGVLDGKDEDGNPVRPTRRDIRNHMRSLQLRNDRSRKDTHPAERGMKWNSSDSDS